jgi:hypothetical protein
MAEFRVPALLQSNKSAGESGGIAPPDACGVAVCGPYAMNGNGLGFTFRLPIPLDAEIEEATIYWTNGGVVVAQWRALSGNDRWSFIAAATAGLIANGGIAFNELSRNTITVNNGAAATAVNIAGQTARIVVTWRRGVNGGVLPGGANIPQNVTSLVGMFADDAQNDSPVTGSLLGLFAREERRLAGQAGVTQIQRSGVGPLLLPKCTMAYADPWGRTLLTSADLGTGPGQIPIDRQQWQSSQFLNNPQCFVRLGDHIRSIGTARRRDAADIIALQSAAVATMALFTVERPPLFSTWWVIIDGVSQEITFQHPAGSDLRRPADIWLQVIVPFMTGKAGIGGPGVSIPQGQTLPTIGTDAAVGPAITWEVSPGEGFFPLVAPVFPVPVFSQRGSLPRGFGFLSYARMLHVWDNTSPYATVAPLIVPVATTPTP